MIVSIIVLFNPDFDHLFKFIESLSSQVDKVILVDNTPQDLKNYLSIEKIKIQKSNIYIDLGDNKGIAFAHNAGIKKARELNSEYLIIFDQDSTVEEGFVNNLVKLYKDLSLDNKKIAAIGPSYLDIKTNQLAPAISFNGLKVIRTIPNPDKNYTPADYIISSGTLIKLSILNEIGLMMEELFIDYVDIEWGLRAKQLGYTCFIANQVVMRHSIGDASIRVPIFNKYVNIHSDFRKYFILRNAIYLILYSNLPLNWRVVQIPKTLMYFMFLLIFLPSKLRTIKIFFKALKDAIFKNMGKGS